MEGDVNGGIASPGAAVMKRGQVVALGQHGEPKKMTFISEVVKLCTWNGWKYFAVY